MLSGALLVARCLRKWRRQGRPTTACTTKTVRSLRLCSSDPKSVSSRIFVPTGACLGVLAAVCLPRRLDASWDGGRWLVRAGHCVRNGRVSGDWRVWACWIPARAATTSPASRLSRRPKRHLALAEVGFLCCIPIARAFCCPERPVSALRRSSRGCGAGWTSKHTLCPTSRARLHVLGLLAHGVVARSLGCGTHCGHEARGLCLPRKTSVLRFVRTTPVAVLGSSHAGDGVGEECYLVDPASSHMLVSKIKPCINSRANTCNKPRLLEGMHLLDKRSTRALPVAAMIHDNSTDRTALVPATHHSNFCPINFRCGIYFSPVWRLRFHPTFDPPSHISEFTDCPSRVFDTEAR
ncbi:UNVERIFIED_CONTAM: hypothetical protein Slati_4556800 [Sesamum latifolium]|uniref:Uncharacterized protein n=1 Tax=Sesamum latifolium TaxID=2727402 RepID=A0AAW2S1S3_9LAMI